MMTDSSNRFKIKNTDFGFASFLQENVKNKDSKLGNLGGYIGSKIHLPNVSYKTQFLHFCKKSLQLFGRLKWKVSRSIFLGRGIYFKYISNLSILIIVIFGTFVYLQFYAVQGKQSFLSSKYAKGASEPESVLIAAGGQSVLPEKQLSVIKYKVNGGDTLSSIAKQFSNSESQISVDSIKWANNLKSDDLQPGTVLDIPPVSGTLHTVGSGETITDIAKKYGKINDKSNEIEVFAAVQQITNDNVLDVKVEGDKKVPVLVPGQRLIISGGIIKEAPQQNTAQVKAPVAAKQPGNAPVSTGYIWPVAGGIGVITQYFTSARMGYGHTGVDIADFSGPVLVAIASGTVVSTGWENGGGGCVVRVKFDTGLAGLYAHTRCNYMVSPGQRVAQGQALVNMGSTGRSTGTHLHFEMFQNGYLINACPYIRCR
jgi:murein DD-endopeptidase MepM/ murein hydrolase activator NlpD